MRGSVYFVNLEPRSGSEQRGTRPCVVVSTDAFNLTTAWQSISIVPITSAKRWLESSPTTVLLDKGEANLPKPSAALAHQITTIDRSKLVGQRIGVLSDERMAELQQAILNYLNIEV